MPEYFYDDLATRETVYRWWVGVAGPPERGRNELAF
jgi:hypothetical protein